MQAPTIVDPPTGVAVTVETSTVSEPSAEEQRDPGELRASWVAERLAGAGGVIAEDLDSGLLIHRYTAIIVKMRASSGRGQRMLGTAFGAALPSELRDRIGQDMLTVEDLFDLLDLLHGAGCW